MNYKSSINLWKFSSYLKRFLRQKSIHIFHFAERTWGREGSGKTQNRQMIFYTWDLHSQYYQSKDQRLMRKLTCCWSCYCCSCHCHHCWPCLYFCCHCGYHCCCWLSDGCCHRFCRGYCWRGISYLMVCKNNTKIIEQHLQCHTHFKF